MDFNINLSDFPAGHKALPLDFDIIYDVLIIGGGPAALTAAVYCMRKGVKTGLIAADIGGQLKDTVGIDNYMGYKHIEGIELVNKFKDQVKQFEIGYGEGLKAISISKGEVKKVYVETGEHYKCRALIIASGKSPRKLGVPGEERLTGRGVAYCAACDAPLFKDKKVAVVGAGNSGVEAAIDLARVATHVTLIEFLDKINADQILRERLEGFRNVDILLKHKVTALNGTGSLKSITVNSLALNEGREIEVEGIFVEIGLTPNSDFADGIVGLNQYKEIKVDCECKTDVPGIFAAGDVTTVPYKQVIIAAGEGAKAALAACNYVLRESKIDYANV